MPEPVQHAVVGILVAAAGLWLLWRFAAMAGWRRRAAPGCDRCPAKGR